MTTNYVALLRAVNVGGTGPLPMAELRALCAGLGWSNPRTHIASGNVVFGAEADEAEVKSALEAALLARFGRRIGVLTRTGAAMARALADNPFGAAAANLTMAIFLDAAPAADFMTRVTGRADETIAPGLREIYVHYPSGQGRSKLRIADAGAGTARNMNTVAKLAEWAAG